MIIFRNWSDSITKEESSELNRLLCRAVVATYGSFHMMDHRCWKELFYAMRPSWKPPSRKTLGNKLLNEEYNHSIRKLDEDIKAASHIAISFDYFRVDYFLII